MSFINSMITAITGNCTDISRLHKYNKQCKQPSFTSIGGVVTKKSGELAYRIDTSFFRNDLYWDNFVRYLSDKYQNAKKVRVINHACSSGYEPYSLALTFMYELGEKAKKFLPIKARDINKANIERAKAGEFRIDSFEWGGIDFYTNNTFEKYFDVYKSDLCSYKAVAKDEIKKTVKFKCKDIFKDMRKISKENTVLLCRNFWPYLSIDEAIKLIDQLATKMKKSSVLVIGDYDSVYSVDKLLGMYGFKKTEINNVYEAPGKNILSGTSKSKIIDKVFAVNDSEKDYSKSLSLLV